MRRLAGAIGGSTLRRPPGEFKQLIGDVTGGAKQLFLMGSTADRGEVFWRSELENLFAKHTLPENVKKLFDLKGSYSIVDFKLLRGN